MLKCSRSNDISMKRESLPFHEMFLKVSSFAWRLNYNHQVSVSSDRRDFKEVCSKLEDTLFLPVCLVSETDRMLLEEAAM